MNDKTFIFEVKTLGLMIGNYETLCRAYEKWGFLNVIVVRSY